MIIVKKSQLILSIGFLFLFLVNIHPIVAVNIDQDVRINVQKRIMPYRKMNQGQLVLLIQNRYHNLTEVYLELENFNNSAPHLIEYSSIGYSYSNNTIPLIKLTNEQIKDQVKGKTYIVAHHHAREQITIEHTLRTIRDLVNKYNSGDDSTINLLDKFIIYFIVTLNPDSLDHVLYENEWLRKTMKPYDDDDDGFFDEDGPSDVDGDGRISEFAVRPKEGWDNKTWVFYYEGNDNDSDNFINEDWIGGVDLNRNYPFHWNDSSCDSGWGNDKFKEDYPGPEPASENETRVLMNFVSSHNFTHAQSLHSGINATLFDWSYTLEVRQAEYLMYELMMETFRDRDLLPESFIPEDISQNDSYVGYTCAGEWADWSYTAQQTISLTTEIYHMEGSDDYLYSASESNSTHYAFELETIFEYFNPPENKIEALHQELFAFQEYWISLTPWIQLVSAEKSSDSTQVSLNVKSGSPYFNTTDTAFVSIVPSIYGYLIDYPRSIAPLQPNDITSVEISFEKDIPTDFYFDINISSNWASDLQCRIEVSSIKVRSTSGFSSLLVIIYLTIAVPFVR